MSIFYKFRYEPIINANDVISNELNAISNGRNVYARNVRRNAIINDGNDES